MNTINAFVCGFVCLATVLVTVSAYSEDNVADFCDLCQLKKNEMACLVCKEALENDELAMQYGDINKRGGFHRQTRMFPCQCCAFSRHQNFYCCANCNKK